MPLFPSLSLLPSLSPEAQDVLHIGHIFLDAHRQTPQTQQRQNQAQSFSLPIQCQQAPLVFSRLLVLLSPSHPNKQTGDHSWYLLFSDQSYSGLLAPQESIFFLSIPRYLPSLPRSHHSLGTSYSPLQQFPAWSPCLRNYVPSVYPPTHTASSMIFLKCQSYESEIPPSRGSPLPVCVA